MAKPTSFDTSFDFGANKPRRATSFQGTRRGSAPKASRGKGGKAAAFRQGGRGGGS